MNENRLAEALDIFSKILVDYPDDLETLLILANIYLASGDGKTAKNIYLRAQKVDPDNKTIDRQIIMAEEIAENGLAEPTPTDFPAVTRLLQRLTGKSKAIDENDIMRAAYLLDKIINSESPAELVSIHLDEIDELLPALIELNIRQAHADGHPELAESLRELQFNIDYQLDAKDDGRSLPELPGDLNQPHFDGNILLLLPDLEKKSNRMTLLKATLESCGCRVSEKDQYVSGRGAKPDVVITSNPHTNPALAESLSALSAAGIPIILDLDTDFEKQPISHHEYNTKGLGIQTRSNAYNSALSLASMVSVPSEMHAVSLKTLVDRVSVIPDGWSRQNKLWNKNAHPRSTINIGWVGTSGQLEDLVLIRRFIIRIIREFPDTRIVVIGNPQAYRLFESLPENRRMYLPVVANEEFPYLLSQLDILLVPLRNLPYNLSLPDTILVEAGARGIPWVASPIPSFRHWSNGGIISESVDEWHLNLRHLVMDRELRQNLGQAGKSAAKSREMDQLGRLWIEMLSQVSNAKTFLLQNTEDLKVY